MEFLNIKDNVIIKKTNCKNPRICIKSNGDIAIYAPKFYTQEQSLELLDTHRGWIKKNLEKIKLAQLEIKKFFANKEKEILFFGEWIEIQKDFNIEYFKKELYTYLQTCVSDFSKKMKVQYNKIAIRSSKTRLGSCTFENNLSFSLLLVFAPRELIDYVVIHELAHIVHKNHSRNFWKLVEAFSPKYKALRKELHSNVKFYLPMLERLLLLSL